MSTEYPISEEQRRFYQENGYIQLFNVLSEEELERLRAALEDVMQVRLDRQHDMTGNEIMDKIFLQKVNLWQAHAGIRQYTFSHKIADIARQLSGARKIRLWHDHALVKMPGDSKPSAWHQDHPYWPMQETGAFSCWMALDDVNEKNGCMAFVPGTHKLGRLEPIRLGDPQGLFALVPPDAPVREFKAQFQPMPAGSCTFHDGLTFHYAGPNTTDRQRRAFITIYMPDEIHYNGASHIVTDDLGLRVGDPLVG